MIADGYIGPATKELLMSSDGAGSALKIGDKGDDVLSVQKLLKKLGYLKSTTGYFGSDTDKAVRNFQKQNRLSVDGTVGAATMNLLTSSKAKAASGSAAVVTGKNASSLVTVAKSKLGCKYVWGAKGPNQFDCSGFVYWCLNKVGVRQGYMTSAGWQKTGKYQRITSMSKIQKGDVISFKGHVGIALGGGQMIDASSSRGKVRITNLNSSYWKRNFVCAYRIF